MRKHNEILATRVDQVLRHRKEEEGSRDRWISRGGRGREARRRQHWAIT